MIFFTFLMVIFFMTPTVFSSTLATLPEIVVYGKHENKDNNNTVSSKDIEQWQMPNPLEALNVLTNSAVFNGSIASFSVGGTKPEHTKLFVDGLNVEDHSTTNGAIDYNNLDINGIKSINIEMENAIGGVVSIDSFPTPGTRQDNYIELETGRFDTYRERVNYGKAVQNSRIWADINHFKTQGFSSVPSIHQDNVFLKRGEPSQKFSSFLRFDHVFNERWSFYSTHRFQKYTQNYSGTSAENPISHDNNTWHLHRVGLRGDLWQGRWEPDIGIGFVRLNRNHHNTTAPFGIKNTYDSGSIQGNFSNIIHISEHHTARAAVKFQNDFYETSQFATTNKGKRQVYKFELGHNAQLGPRFNMDIHGNFDHLTKINMPVTYGAKMSYTHLETKTRPFIGFSTSARAPSLFQVHDLRFGNPYLRPETGKKTEFGVEQKIRAVKFKVTYFVNLIKNPITTMASNGVWMPFTNTPRMKIYGVESSINAVINKQMTVFIKHTFANSKDYQNKQVIRQPLHRVSAGLRYDITDEWDMSVSATHYGKTLDYRRFAPYGTIYKGGILTARLTSSYKIEKNFQVFGRVENCLNRKYEQPEGYQQPGLAMYAGLRYMV